MYKEFQNVPSSTPNNQLVAGRKPIRPCDESVSPIRTDIAGSENSDSSDEDDSSNPHSSKSHTLSKNDSQPKPIVFPVKIVKYAHRNAYANTAHSSTTTIEPSNITSVSFSNCLWGFLSFVGIALLGYVISSQNIHATDNTISIEEIQYNFPLQSEDTWIALTTGIEEVKNFHKPSVFLLLYEDESEETLNEMLKNISQYAACALNDCEAQPIVVTNTILSTDKVKSDYGYVIDTYKSELEQKGVMVVKNLDQVPGKVAQAFHSMCDEYTPLVANTVFFFTMKIEDLKKLSKKDLQIVEEVLRHNWRDLDEDIFYPLFVRISSMVLRIVPEKHKYF